MQCNVEFGYQLSICSETKENHGKHSSSWPVAKPSECKLTSSQQSGINSANPNISPYSLQLYFSFLIFFSLFFFFTRSYFIFTIICMCIWFGQAPNRIKHIWKEQTHTWTNTHTKIHISVSVFFLDYRHIWEYIGVCKSDALRGLLLIQ
jgi:hypothetical protein